MNDCETQAEMPKYVCHKQVRALKIKSIKPLDGDGDLEITPEENGYAPFAVSGEYAGKHTPEVGGYYVVYKDGYKSYSPAKAFEGGYVALNNGRDGEDELTG